MPDYLPHNRYYEKAANFFKLIAASLLILPVIRMLHTISTDFLSSFSHSDVPAAFKVLIIILWCSAHSRDTETGVENYAASTFSAENDFDILYSHTYLLLVLSLTAYMPAIFIPSRIPEWFLPIYRMLTFSYAAPRNNETGSPYS